MSPALPQMNYIYSLIKVLKRLFSRDECNAILDKIATKLHESSTKPRSILNTLSLIEFLLKNGSPKFKVEIEEDQYFIKKFKTYFDENDDEDLSKSIQTLSIKIISLLESPEELKEAKEEAKKMKNRIMGFSNELGETSGTSGDSKYQGISSDSYQNSRDNWIKDTNNSQKPGLEQRADRKKESTEEQTEQTKKSEGVQKQQKSQIIDVDLLGENSEEASKKDKNIKNDFDFLNSEPVKKPKTLGKLLPPPPSKNTKNSQNQNSNGKHTSESNQSKSNTLLDTDLSQLNFTQPQNSQTPVYNHQISSQNSEFDLMDLNLNIENTKPIIANQQRKQSFDFDFEGTKTQPNVAQKSNSDNFDFMNLGDTQSKPISKLTAPPKKHSNSNSNQNDLLF